MSAATLRDRRGGFVLSVVVFLLFAVGMAAAAGYAVVDLEADMAGQASEGEHALAVARAGLERYMGEHLGLPSDSMVYAVGAGTAVVHARRLGVADAASGTELYLLESHGEVVDPVNPLSPARRVVRQYAHLETQSVGRHAAATLSFFDVDLYDWGQIRGNDHSIPGTCPESGTEAVPGMVYWGRGTLLQEPWDSIAMPYGSTPPGWGSNGAILGSPDAVVAYNDHETIYEAVGVRWDVLKDPAFPVDYDGEKPNFMALPAEEYPVVRVNGNLTAGASWSGRGVLIVTGRIRFDSGFYWDGIVIAGDMAFTNHIFWIRGMLIAGMNGNGGYLDFNGYPIILYDVCSALAASRSLSYFEPVEGTWWEAR